MGMFFRDNVRVLPVRDDFGMRQHREWWALNADLLDWAPIATFPDEPYATAILRDARGRWTYGCRLDGQWHRFTEGAAWHLAGFHPLEWAPVNVDDAIELSQE